MHVGYRQSCAALAPLDSAPDHARPPRQAQPKYWTQFVMAGEGAT
jgi:hypothetical protein